MLLSFLPSLPPSLLLSGTAIGLKCKDGIVLAVENLLLSKLLVANSNRRTFGVGSHVSIAVAGRREGGREGGREHNISAW